MDITIDVGNLYFGLKAVEQVEANLSSFANSFSGLSVSSELPSASLLGSVKNSLNGLINSEIRELRIRLENSKTIIEENDAEAAMLFGYMEQGYINEDLEFIDMPFMDQTDYGNVRYSAGSVASSGCGLTSVCMVATYLTGELYTPDELAPLVNSAGSNVDRMTKAADIVGLNWYCNENTSRKDLVQMLEEGKIVVCLVNSSTHFVVCKGLTEDGKILVNDPYGPWAKDSGYTMEELNMSAGKTWVFDPADNPPKGNNSSLGDVTISNAVVSQIDNVSGDVLLTGEELESIVVSDNVDTQVAVNLRESPESIEPVVNSNDSANSNNNANSNNSFSTDNKSNTNVVTLNNKNNNSNKVGSATTSSSNVSYKGTSSGGYNSNSTSIKTTSTSVPKNTYSGVVTTTPATVPLTSTVTTPIVVPETVPVISTNSAVMPETMPVVVPETMPITNPVVVPETTPVTVPLTQPVTMPMTNPSVNPVTQPVVVSPVTSPTTVIDNKNNFGIPLAIGVLGATAVGGIAYKAIKGTNDEKNKKIVEKDKFESYDEDEIIIPDNMLEISKSDTDYDDCSNGIESESNIDEEYL